MKSLFFILLLSAQMCSAGFVAIENGEVLSVKGNISEQHPPCSTFKIALSLMGFDSGILHNAHAPVWEWQEVYREQLPGILDRWMQPHDPELWMINSCVWYSQVLTQKLGVEIFEDYLYRLDYGNGDASGDPGKGNGLTHCWLMSSLKISPVEQVEFLYRLTRGELPVSVNAHEVTKQILYRGRLKGEWELYGKTGSGSVDDLSNGWFVGWVQNGKRTIIFAQHIFEKKVEGVYGSTIAIERALENLEKLL